MIVKTLLDTDLYKFTTSYAYIKLFPMQWARLVSTTGMKLNIPKDFLKALKAEIKNLSQLRFTEEELEYMTKKLQIPSESLLGVVVFFFVSIRIRLIFIWMKLVISTSK